jgi:hypothetical protein
MIHSHGVYVATERMKVASWHTIAVHWLPHLGPLTVALPTLGGEGQFSAALQT